MNEPLDSPDRGMLDEGSSSLSEPDESIEGRDIAPDSEAETERIDNTPRKLDVTDKDEVEERKRKRSSSLSSRNDVEGAPKKGKKGQKGTPEDDEVIEEERDRKHNALEVLNKIERQFLTFQKRRLDERLELLSIELNQLQTPNSTHEEYQLMMQAVDQRRDEKIRQENVRLALKKDILKKHFVAMRGSIHGQFAHDVGDIRMSFLTQCNQRITQLQRERRYWGTNETDYTIKYNDKRSQQALQQSAYNLEVSILSGVAKYVGFPAAPNLNSARAPEIDQDLTSMGIPRPAFTPAQRNVVDVGSASTIETSPLKRPDTSPTIKAETVFR